MEQSLLENIDRKRMVLLYLKELLELKQIVNDSPNESGKLDLLSSISVEIKNTIDHIN